MNRHQRRAPIIALAATTTLALLTIPPALANHYEASLEGSFFEIDDDANLAVDSQSGFDDWASVAEDRQADAPTGKEDDSYTGGAKEDDLCPSVGTGSIPPNKSDLLNFGVYEEPGDPGFLHLFWHRVQEPSGTTLMDFELNQGGEDCGNGANVNRTTGDLLIEYRIEQGGARAAILVREWTGSAWGPAEDFTAGGKATGTINNTAIPAAEADGLGAISPRTFGEASIDLDFIFDSDECRSFGSAFLKSRSSTSFTSALKDFIAPRAIEIGNCGQIDIVKTDDTGAALAGAEFTLYVDNDPTAADGQTEPGVEDTATTQTCTTDAEGECTITNVLQGSYWVVETVTPANHETADPQPAVVVTDATVTLTFVNVRQRGSILIEKVDEDGAPLAGAAFTVTPGDLAMEEVATGVFCVDDLTFGDYTVSETTTPAGYQTAPDQDVSVGEKSDCDTRVDDEDDPDATFVNAKVPGDIEVEKTDDDGAPLAGVGFTVFIDDDEDGTWDESNETTVAAAEQLTGADGTTTFEDLDADTYYCVVETSTPTGYAEADPTAQCGYLGLGDAEGDGDLLQFTFTNEQLHKVIIIVCHEADGTFAPSDTSYGSSLSSADLGAGDPTEAELCALAGDTGNAHGDSEDVTVGHG